jgi:hypothetical protein
MPAENGAEKGPEPCEPRAESTMEEVEETIGIVSADGSSLTGCT